ncbi:Threonine dehydrogenase and related Zn-dependent dehydrogenases [Helicobacter heilmannii]|uniref:zinc-binding dehydrogenase n=1 Tax=Helicobacter heilmannii TaxID=35817 RepID=UPI0006A19037|nr:zinc-binding dehydrogenase [Helicobacter heilmannii]CRF47150.1 Threonine dehydrogenase and related Zn-dependent dehydrogenases [Helicobacter heilmannii]
MVKGFAMLGIGKVGIIEKESLECVVPVRQKLELGPKDAFVRPLAVAPCTSDLHTCYEGGIGERTDMFLGHEGVGEVLQVGALVQDFKEGDIVIIPAITPDWSSLGAQRGYAQHDHGALSGWKFSNFKDGVFAEKIHINDADGNLGHLPEGVEITDAVMLSDMITTGFHCAEQAAIKPGDRVAVVGLGPVGLMALAGANLMGASEIYAVDCVPFRYEVAHKHYGATHFVDFSKAPMHEQILELTKGVGADKILIAGGGTGILSEACACLINGGVVSNVNYFGSGEVLPLSREAWNVGMGHKTIKGGLTPGGRYRMEKLARLLQTQKLSVKPIITHHLEGKFEEIAQALAWMKDKPANFIKPVVKIKW